MGEKCIGFVLRCCLRLCLFSAVCARFLVCWFFLDSVVVIMVPLKSASPPYRHDNGNQHYSTPHTATLGISSVPGDFTQALL